MGLIRKRFTAPTEGGAMNQTPGKCPGTRSVRLLKAFEQWCKNRQVAEINFGINSVEEAREMQRLGGFARKMGYAKVGENYVRTL